MAICLVQSALSGHAIGASLQNPGEDDNRTLAQLEAAIRVEIITPAAPDDGITEEAGQPEAKAEDVLQDHEMPAGLGAQDPGGCGPGGESAEDGGRD